MHIPGLTALGISFSWGVEGLPAIWLRMSCSLLLVSSGYLLNRIFEAKEKNMVFSRQSAVISSLLPLAPLIPAWPVDLGYILLLCIGMLSSILYSAPPFKLKQKAYLREALNMLGFTVIFLLGYAVFDVTGLILALFVSSLVFSAEILHCLCHEKEDSMQGVKNILLRCGVDASAGYYRLGLYLAFFFSLAYGYLAGDLFFPAATLALILSLSHICGFIRQSNNSGNSVSCKRLVFRKLSLVYALALAFQRIII